MDRWSERGSGPVDATCQVPLVDTIRKGTIPSGSGSSGKESGVADVVVVPKFDMQCHESKMTGKDVKLLVRKYNVPLDLHPCAPTKDRRAIPDAMAWRHHESDVYDAFRDNDFTIQDVYSLTERVIDLRPVPSRLLYGAGLATTWEFPGYFPVFKDTGGNVVTMSEYLHFPLFLGEDGEHRTLNDEGLSVSHSPQGSSNESTHHFVNVEENKSKESPPRMEPFVNLSGQTIHPPKEQVFVSEANVGKSSHPLNTVNWCSCVPAERDFDGTCVSKALNL
ncbi:hypothetical protein Tco_0703465 [Tanacetum coccineum]|uniref:Uncharacterized protein n=1 Tax=Tanacetum coccineum TaxID=301880 RepID=A0ABQ4XZH4_9ASTR